MMYWELCIYALEKDNRIQQISEGDPNFFIICTCEEIVTYYRGYAKAMKYFLALACVFLGVTSYFYYRSVFTDPTLSILSISLFTSFGLCFFISGFRAMYKKIKEFYLAQTSPIYVQKIKRDQILEQGLFVCESM